MGFCLNNTILSADLHINFIAPQLCVCNLLSTLNYTVIPYFSVFDWMADRDSRRNWINAHFMQFQMTYMFCCNLKKKKLNFNNRIWNIVNLHEPSDDSLFESLFGNMISSQEQNIRPMKKQSNHNSNMHVNRHIFSY